VPDFKPAGGQRFDYWGALTLCITLLAFLVGLTTGQRSGFGALPVVVLLITALVFLVIFINLELRVEQPMLDLRLFKNSLFSVSLITGFIVFLCLSGSLLLIPFYAENALGLNPQQTGLLMGVVPLALGIVAPISGALSDRYGSRLITVAGLAVLTLGFFLVSGLDAETSIPEYILRFLPIGVGMGMFQSPNNSTIMGAAPRSRLGIASGMLSVTRTLGQTAGIAILGALWAGQVFKHAGNVLPGGASTAPVAAQVAGLQTTFLLVSVLIFLALLLSIWGLREEGKLKAA
jgi:MFS family permease